MSKKKEKINPERGLRLKQLLRAENVSQAKLSEKIHISQQYISQISTGKAQLTEHIAQDVAKLFPEKDLLYKWLLCEEDYKSTLEALQSERAKIGAEENTLYSGFYNFAKLAGYEIDIIPDPEDIDPLRKLIHALVPKYQIRKEGKILAELDKGQLLSLENKAFDLFSVFLDGYFD